MKRSFCVIKVFSIEDLAQNIVNGGTPLIFLVIISVELEFKKFFLMLFFSFFTVTIKKVILVEYSIKNVETSLDEHKDPIRSHPLLLRDERARNLFIEFSVFNFVSGTEMVAIAIRINHIQCSHFSDKLKTRKMGATFCHVIITSIQ